MKCTIVILFIYCAVSSAQSIGNSNKDVDHRWSWGLVDETTKSSIVDNRVWGHINITDTQKEKSENLLNTSTEPPAETTEYDPCASYNPPKPSFKAQGRRINEEKCEEYIYDIKLFQEKVKRNDECDIMKAEEHGIRLPSYVVGGYNALPGEFPHMGALGWRTVSGAYVFKCGSTLISSKFVMTAAHCIRAPPDTTIDDPEPKIVRLNDKNYFVDSDGNYLTSSRDQDIIRIIVHPNYTPPKKYYDIALMEVASEVHFTHRMRPACLWNRPDTGDFGNEVSLTGWGVLAPGSLQISPNLQAADVDIIDSAQCNNLLEGARNRNWQGLTENQLCAGRLEGGVDACQGDSGGPLQFRKPIYTAAKDKIYYVIGVTSFGVGCALPDYPGIYTRVSSFIDWIEEVVWK